MVDERCDLDAAVAGDPGAFADLYRALQPGLHRYATVLVGQDADDVTAEAWLQIARDVRGFTGGLAGFRFWAARIVHNRAMDLARSNARRPTSPLDTDEAAQLAGTDDTAGSAIEYASTEAAVGLIATLPRDQAQAVLLRVVVGLDATATGRILGKSPNAVRVNTHRGLRRLAERLTEPDVDVVRGGEQQNASSLR